MPLVWRVRKEHVLPALPDAGIDLAGVPGAVAGRDHHAADRVAGAARAASAARRRRGDPDRLRPAYGRGAWGWDRGAGSAIRLQVAANQWRRPAFPRDD